MQDSSRLSCSSAHRDRPAPDRPARTSHGRRADRQPGRRQRHVDPRPAPRAASRPHHHLDGHPRPGVATATAGRIETRERGCSLGRRRQRTSCWLYDHFHLHAVVLDSHAEDADSLVLSDILKALRNGSRQNDY
jgi:hypothetical protein